MIEKNRALVAVLAFATIASSILILKYRMQKSKHFKWIFNYFSPCRKKNITEVSEMLGDDSFLVCLTFEPAGRAVNQCAVCGATEKYNRKNIIPFEYRKFFSRTKNNLNLENLILFGNRFFFNHFSCDVCITERCCAVPEMPSHQQYVRFIATRSIGH